MAIGATVCLSCLLAISFLGRDQFRTFVALYCFGYALCIGLTYMVPVQIAWSLYPKKLGLVSGLVIGGFGIGNIMCSKMSTMIVNP